MEKKEKDLYPIIPEVEHISTVSGSLQKTVLEICISLDKLSETLKKQQEEEAKFYRTIREAIDKVTKL